MACRNEEVTRFVAIISEFVTISEDCVMEASEIILDDEISIGLAREAINLKQQIDELTKSLDSKKEELRQLADSRKLKIVAAGLGIILVSAPRSESRKSTLVFNEKRLENIPELKKRLIDSQVLVYEDVITPAAKASVTIKPNA